jgi:hypothetical protein
MIAVVRPDSWNLPLFLHVLGAMALVGSVATTCVLAASSQKRIWLRGITLRTWLLVVLPAWLLMRVAGQWSDSRETIGDDSTWLGIGYIVADAGVLVLIVTGVVGWMSTRRPERCWAARIVAALAGLYLATLLLAMFAMSGKPGS